MDKLSYGFQSINGQPTNRLATLTDAGDKLNTLALENAVHNYTYDFSGNLVTDVKADISAITWTPDGKVDRVTKTNGKVIQFLYDARGDKVCGASLGDEYEYYLRDANGEILEILTIKAAYISSGSANDPWLSIAYPNWFPVPPSISQKGGKEQNLKNYDLDELQETCSENPTPEQMVLQSWKCWDTTSIDIVDETNPFLNPLNQQPDPLAYFAAAKNEWLIYGSEGHGRFAKANPNDNDRWGYSNEIFLRDEPFTEDRYLKSKQYELKDHLGNVRVVLSDYKSSLVTTDSTRPYNATVLSAYNYYPFGMLQQGLYSETGTTYRFGFNGMMWLDKVMDLVNTSPTPNEGVGNALDFGARLYNPRVGRFFSLDPLRTAFPWQSPYLFADNNPVLKIDFNGNYGFISVTVGTKKSKIDEVVKAINLEMEGLNLTADDKGQLILPEKSSYKAKTDLETHFIEALRNEKQHFLLKISDNSIFFDDISSKYTFAFGAAYSGAKLNPTNEIVGTNVVVLYHLIEREKVGGVSLGKNLLHESVEAYLGAVTYGVHTYDEDKYNIIHNNVMDMDETQDDGVKQAINKNIKSSLYEYFYDGPKGKSRTLFTTENPLKIE